MRTAPDGGGERGSSIVISFYPGGKHQPGADAKEIDDDDQRLAHDRRRSLDGDLCDQLHADACEGCAHERPLLVQPGAAWSLTNFGNVLYSAYVFSLPVGPIWALHSFYLVATALMLAWYVRYSRGRGGPSRELQMGRVPGVAPRSGL